MIKQYDIWIADLNPRSGTETGKMRPVLIVQTDFLNDVQHPSTIICPLTTNVKRSAHILRVHVSSAASGLKNESDVMIDQIRAIDNRRLVKKIGQLPDELTPMVKNNISTILNL